MKVTRFHPDRDLIIIGGRVWSPDGRREQELSLVLDTGAAVRMFSTSLATARGLENSAR